MIEGLTDNKNRTVGELAMWKARRIPAATRSPDVREEGYIVVEKSR
jgi:hypothetical protein